MITFPKAKINLGLRVTGKRPDGYHNIETVYYPVGLCDALEFIFQPGETEDEITVTGLDIKTRSGDNLVVKAVKAMREKYPFPALKIHLHKAIPSGAGLGGGSSDAACMLKALNKYLGLNINPLELKSIALEIGSDCPFFIDPVPSVAKGRGELLKPLLNKTIEGQYLILLNPGISVSTRDAYNNTGISSADTQLELLLEENQAEWKKTILNDFEDYVFRLYPEIKEIKASLYSAGALYSSMSGSGSTVYGIFEKKPELPVNVGRYVIYSGTID